MSMYSHNKNILHKIIKSLKIIIIEKLLKKKYKVKIQNIGLIKKLFLFHIYFVMLM
jgi:hypothetical protein